MPKSKLLIISENMDTMIYKVFGNDTADERD